MKFNSRVIIACPDMVDGEGVHYLGEMDGRNAQHTDHVIVYVCGAETRDEIAPFIERSIKKFEKHVALGIENSEQKTEVVEYIEWLKELLIDVNNTVLQKPLREKLKMAIINQIKESDATSWKFITALMDDARYLVLCTVDIRTV